MTIVKTKRKNDAGDEDVVLCVRCWGEMDRIKKSSENWDSMICWGCIGRKQLEIESNPEYIEELVSLRSNARVKPHRTIRNFVRNYLGLNKRKRRKSRKNLVAVHGTF